MTTLRSILLLLLLINGPTCISQETYTITGEIKGFPGGKVLIADFYGEQVFVFDSVVANKEQPFSFTFSGSHLPGYYRIILGKEHYIDFIFNNEDVSFTTWNDHLMDSLLFYSSRENILYYDFIDLYSRSQLMLDLLGPLIDYFPRGDSFYLAIVNRFTQIQQDVQQYIENFETENPGAYVTKVVLNQKRPFIDPALSDSERRKYYREHFWDKINLKDYDLLRSNVYPNLIIECLSLYSNRNYTQEQLEESFISAVDDILAAAMDDETIYHFFLEYLAKGFERYHFDKVIDHIATQYIQEDACENEDLDAELVKRLKNYQNLSIGKAAPEINLNDMNGKVISFNTIQNQYVLIIFWASWCPHCTALLPRLNNYYKETPLDLEIIAVSIDSDLQSYLKALEEGNYSWINSSELKGWDSPTAIAYNVYATPTMFLLDSNRMIIAKPLTFDSLMVELKKL